MIGLMKRVKLLFKQKVLCNHLEYDGGWLVQDIRLRQCKKCGLVDVQTYHGRPDFEVIRPDLPLTYENS